jgi:hypothetical protein
MKPFVKYLLAAFISAGALAAAAPPAAAHVTVSVGIPVYYGYNYNHPCSYYFRHDLPAPGRCYAHYRHAYPHIYLYGGFVFRDRVHYNHWRNRDDFRHWRNHRWNHHHH